LLLFKFYSSWFVGVKTYNKGCKDLYERIVAKGKSKKPAFIAVCNKLLQLQNQD
jgi:hypothetical protein